uniref:Uncharacterized protein n=1 Tax=Globisporangium ultimum (strain ATCC 200006 / CBS 805.95 / DAOM BR144) TaxID=431595 RepID=K3X0D4_GLOUD
MARNGAAPDALAREMTDILRCRGAKLVCIDFDATFVRVHTGGAWTRSALELRAHVRPLFLALLPLLVRADMRVAVVTFSPQVSLIRDVIALCFPPQIAQQVILRGDDASWQLVHADTVDFVPLWQTNGRHLDRKFKLPFVISAARQASKERCDVVRNRDTVLVDDDAVNIRVAIDSGITGIYFDPHEGETTDEEKELATTPAFDSLMKQLRRLQADTPAASTTSAPAVADEPNPTTIPRTPQRTPKHPTARMVRLMTTPESRFVSTSASASRPGRRRASLINHGGATQHSSRFNLCTPSPVLRLKSTVDMGRPRSKRSIRLMRNIEDDLQDSICSSSSSSSRAEACLECNPWRQWRPRRRERRRSCA